MIEEDEVRLLLLSDIEQSCNSRFYSVTTFKLNKLDASKACAPLSVGSDLHHLLNNFTFGSKCVYTMDKFENHPHLYHRITSLALGFFTMIDCLTSYLYFSSFAESLTTDTHDTYMYFPGYNLIIKLAQPDILCEMTWVVDKVHYRTTSTTHHQTNNVLTPEQAEQALITIFGSLIQVNTCLPAFIQQLHQAPDKNKHNELESRFADYNNEYDLETCKIGHMHESGRRGI